jgi:hypothetical protein
MCLSLLLLLVSQISLVILYQTGFAGAPSFLQGVDGLTQGFTFLFWLFWRKGLDFCP